MGTPRATSGAFGYDDMGQPYGLVVAGWTTGDVLLQTVERYNPDLDQWDSMSNFDDSRAQLAGVSAGGRYFAGLGTTSTINAQTAEWFEYLVASDSWAARADYDADTSTAVGRASNAGVGIVP